VNYRFRNELEDILYDDHDNRHFENKARLSPNRSESSPSPSEAGVKVAPRCAKAAVDADIGSSATTVAATPYGLNSPQAGAMFPLTIRIYSQ
jgi:hypothetical protein